MKPFSRLSLALLLGLAACGGESTSPPALASLTVTLSSPIVAVGQSSTATATGTDQNGGAVATGTVTWTSSNPSVASIAPTGAISALSAGTTTITGTASGKSGQATLTVGSVTCNSNVRPTLGEIRTLTQAEAAGVCLTPTTAATEYVMVAFNNSNVAATTTPFELQSSGTTSVTLS
ncbi:MAG TPA: Ig-like domain-containing protein, partial [Gemmatimonadaceae bacterium]